MKKLILLLTAFVFLSNAVYSAVIHEGEYLPWDKFNVTGDTYTVRGTQPVGDLTNYSKAIIRRIGAVNTSYLIDKSSCTTGAEYLYCYDDLRFSDDSKTIDDDGFFQPYVKIRILSNTALLTVTKTDEVTLNYNEERSMTISVKNEDIKSAMISYTEVFPSAIKVIAEDNCQIENNVLYFTYNMPGGSTKDCKFKINSKSYYNSSTVVKYTTYIDSKSTEVAMKPTRINMNLPYEITESMNPETSGNLEQFFEYTFRIKNLDSSNNLLYNIAAQTKDYKSLKTSGIGDYDGIAKQSGSLSPGEDYSFTIRFQPRYTGSRGITGLIKINIGDKEFELDLNKNYTVTMMPLKADLWIDKNSLVTGDNVRINLTINNEDKFKNYYNLRGAIQGTKNISIYRSGIAFNNAEIIYSNESIVPSINSTTIKFSFNASYETANGERFRVYTEKIVPLTFNPDINISINDTGDNITEFLENDSIIFNDTLPSNNSKTSLNDSTTPNTNVSDNKSIIKQEEISEEETNRKEFINNVFKSINDLINSILGI